LAGGLGVPLVVVDIGVRPEVEETVNRVGGLVFESNVWALIANALAVECSSNDVVVRAALNVFWENEDSGKSEAKNSNDLGSKVCEHLCL